MPRPLLPVYEQPLQAATTAVETFLETPSAERCPFAEHFETRNLSEADAYHSDEMPMYGVLGAHDFKLPTETGFNLQILLNVALKDTLLLYGPVHDYLLSQREHDDQVIASDQVVPILQQSLPMARRFGSVKADDAHKLMGRRRDRLSNI